MQKRRREFLAGLACVALFTTVAGVTPAKPLSRQQIWDQFLNDTEEQVLFFVDDLETDLSPENVAAIIQELEQRVINRPLFQDLCSGWQLLDDTDEIGRKVINLSLCRRHDFQWHRIRIVTGFAV
jgi:hypothetical protein